MHVHYQAPPFFPFGPVYLLTANKTIVKVLRNVFVVHLQLQRSPDSEEARDQLMKTNELVELQEEAHAAYHQGDYSTTVNVLERVIEVWVVSQLALLGTVLLSWIGG